MYVECGGNFVHVQEFPNLVCYSLYWLQFLFVWPSIRVLTYYFSMYVLISLKGLREAQDKVNDYSPLMKVFPVNELLAAETLEAIKLAVAAVYAHLRKIRTTSYPSQRAIYLVEAIARDLTTQLVKVCTSELPQSAWKSTLFSLQVLGTYKLMLVTYEEFEQVHIYILCWPT